MNLSTPRFLETQFSMDPEMVIVLMDSILRMLRESMNPYLGESMNPYLGESMNLSTSRFLETHFSMDPEMVPSKHGLDGSCFDGFIFENVERIQESLFRRIYESLNAAFFTHLHI